MRQWLSQAARLTEQHAPLPLTRKVIAATQISVVMIRPESIQHAEVVLLRGQARKLFAPVRDAAPGELMRTSAVPTAIRKPRVVLIFFAFVLRYLLAKLRVSTDAALPQSALPHLSTEINERR